MVKIDDLIAAWRDAGITSGTVLIVHSSLSSLGEVSGGAPAVVDSLCRAAGTVAVPAFTPQVNEDGPVFHPDLPSTMGAIAETLRLRPDAVRSSHPQASVAAAGTHAHEIVASHPLGFAVGPGSPFDRLHDLDAHILLIGVGHDRNSFLHYAETFVPRRRLKTRRIPYLAGGERLLREAPDVGDDNGTHFPVVGKDFEHAHGIAPFRVGAATCRLIPARPFVDFAIRRLGELLSAA